MLLLPSVTAICGLLVYMFCPHDQLLI